MITSWCLLRPAIEHKTRFPSLFSNRRSEEQRLNSVTEPYLVCRLLLEKKKNIESNKQIHPSTHISKNKLTDTKKSHTHANAINRTIIQLVTTV